MKIIYKDIVDGSRHFVLWQIVLHFLSVFDSGWKGIFLEKLFFTIFLDSVSDKWMKINEKRKIKWFSSGIIKYLIQKKEKRNYNRENILCKQKRRRIKINAIWNSGKKKIGARKTNRIFLCII